MTGPLSKKPEGELSHFLTDTLALAIFAAVDLILIIATPIYSLSTFPSTSPMDSLDIWAGSLLGWLIDLIMMSMIGFAAAALGATIGKQPRY